VTHIVLVSVIIVYHMQCQVNQFLRVIIQLLFILLIYVPTYNNIFNNLKFQQEMYKIFTRYLYFPKISRIEYLIIKFMLIIFKCYSSLYFIFKIK